MTDNAKKSLLILGSTGSVGEQAVDVALKENISVKAICANRSFKRVEEQVRQLRCGAVAMSDTEAAAELKIRLADTDTKVFSGEAGIEEMINESDVDVALNSVLGEAGLMPTIASIKSGKKLALANKESLVVAGDIVMALASEHGTEILPVDSEHCAIYQCLRVGDKKDVKKLILTASGGPFFGKKREELEKIRPCDALAHPTWNMGAKITIDSATLMNKGFEVIEAAHLFSVPAEKISVLVHRESIIHSMVEYIDNSVIAQLSVPDMRLCVQYALSAPRKDPAVIDELDLADIAALTFKRPDTETFVLLKTAMYAMSLGGAVPAVLNAANEVAVAAFLKEKIGFTDIFDSVTQVVSDMSDKSGVHTLEGIIEADREARRLTEKILTSKG